MRLNIENENLQEKLVIYENDEQLIKTNKILFMG